MDTNFWGVVDVSKRALAVMRDQNARSGQRGGVIANLSSIGGFIGFPGQSFYHASKFAVEGWTEAVAKELSPDWNIHLSIIEPGGVKTEYATGSLKANAHKHAAYADPSLGANVMLGYITSEQGRAAWAEPSALAAAIYLVVSRGEPIPVRVPLGADAWGLISKDVDDTKSGLEAVKDISVSVGEAKQLDSIKFLL
ncbi:hypothetical protein CDD83_6280 [Cordyceps sp. RAO-2017]|nr:hypothetical protein CDD83_6280 [Cordyceps sp. RAO-2017]